jgi:hypothetical protein
MYGTAHEGFRALWLVAYGRFGWVMLEVAVPGMVQPGGRHGRLYVGLGFAGGRRRWLGNGHSRTDKTVNHPAFAW